MRRKTSYDFTRNHMNEKKTRRLMAIVAYRSN
jgi:hypothetical protein